MFKIGDKVRRLNGSNVGVNEGEVGTIIDFDDNDMNWLILNIGHGSHASYNLELVTENSELEELVKKANEGYKAIDLIRKNYKNEVELKSWGHPFAKLNEYLEPARFEREFRIKPKSKKFKVLEWDAEIVGEQVQIGCKTFDKYQLKIAMSNLARGLTSRQEPFSATRHGIEFEQYQITWQEAEELLKELEK